MKERSQFKVEVRSQKSKSRSQNPEVRSQEPNLPRRTLRNAVEIAEKVVAVKASDGVEKWLNYFNFCGAPFSAISSELAFFTAKDTKAQ